MASKYDWTLGLVDELSKPASEMTKKVVDLDKSLTKLDEKEVSPEIKVTTKATTKIDAKAVEAELQSKLSTLQAKIPAEIKFKDTVAEFGKQSALVNSLKTVVASASSSMSTSIANAANKLTSIANASPMIQKAISAAKSSFSSLASVASPIVSAFYSIGNEAAYAANKLGPVFSTGFNAVKTASASAVGAVTSIVTSMFKGIKTVASSAMSGIGSMISGAFQNPLQTAFYGVQLLKDGFSALSSMFPGLKDLVVQIGSVLKTFSLSALTSVDAGPVKDLLSNFMKFFTTASPELNKIRGAFSEVLNAVMMFIKPFSSMDTVKGSIMGVYNVLRVLVNGLIMGAIYVIKFVKGIEEGFSSSVGPIKEQLIELGTEFKNVMVYMKPVGIFLGQVLGVAVRIVLSGVQLLIVAIKGIVNGFTPFIDSIKNSTDRIGKLFSSTTSVSGVMKVLSGIFSTVGNVIGTVFGGTITVVLGLFELVINAVLLLNQYLDSLGIGFSGMSEFASSAAAVLTDVIGGAIQTLMGWINSLSDTLNALLLKGNKAGDSVKKAQAEQNKTNDVVKKAEVPKPVIPTLPKALTVDLKAATAPKVDITAKQQADSAKLQATIAKGNTASANTASQLVTLMTQQVTLLQQLVEKNPASTTV